METISLKQTIKPVFDISRLTFGIVPVVAGLDKFTNLLTNWEQYLHPALVKMLPLAPHTFMMIIGVVEIAAGIMVLRKPALGGLVVAAWLSLVALSLLVSGQYLDVAVRDLVMAMGAFTMAKLAKIVA